MRAPGSSHPRCWRAGKRGRLSTPRRSSGPRRQWKVATAISRRCSTTIAACPCDAIRCGPCCTILIVGPRTGRHRRHGFSGGRFPICSRVCCHRSTRCPCQGTIVRPSRQVIEEAGCPALRGCPGWASLPEAAALTLDHLDFALDFLVTHIEAIEREIFFRTADLFRADVDLIFWDTTSVYFEVDDEDTECETKRDTTLPPLRQRGYNKEGRGNQPQVVVGLALTRDGLPVRSWVFPGHTVDATTVAQGKESLRGWTLGRSIFVGDAGMDAEATGRPSPKGSAPLS